MTIAPDALTRAVTSTEIDEYHKYGMVHLRQILSPSWLRKAEHMFGLVMNPHAQRSIMDVGTLAEELQAAGVPLLDSGVASGRFQIASYNWTSVPELAAIVMGAPLPELAAALLGATRINFFGDQLFVKEPASNRRTAFHQDAPYYHFTGNQSCSLWIPIDEVRLDSGAMGYVRGSHRWPVYAANVFASQMPLPGSPEQRLPDIEGNERHYDIVYVETDPGDVIVHNVRTVHGSRANTTGHRARRALVARYTGDDVRYFERSYAPDTALKSASLKDGDRLDSPEFPLLWTRARGYEAHRHEPQHLASELI
jgi:ectoine hydroxylase-related dioxygenase (phytanoyl-CoA dioxygenase family)